MKPVTMYQAEDGSQFRTEVNCLEYEQRCIDLSEASEMLKNGSTLLSALVHANRTCSAWDSYLTIDDKNILMKITKDTGLVISHWQCSDEPAYKPCGLGHGGKVYLRGDTGGWSGAYGNWVGLTDLLRYARNTLHLEN